MPAYDPISHIGSRILEAIRLGEQWPYPDEDNDPWIHRPGSMPWSALRRRVGGHVRAPEFAMAVERLIDEGRLIEIWLEPRGMRRMGHSLLLPGRSEAVDRPIVMAKGRPDVLAAEPWAAELGLQDASGEQMDPGD
jgi:hypothetical protein